MAKVLGAVRAPAFPLKLGQAGVFSPGGSRTILWIGIASSDALLALHAATGAALASAGFTPEARPYVPHITVARLGAGAPADIGQGFLRPVPDPAAPEFECEAFALYASQVTSGSARYRILETWPLG
jgi:2'-5' RNA ligase